MPDSLTRTRNRRDRFATPRFQEKLVRAREYQRNAAKSKAGFWFFVSIAGLLVLTAGYFLTLSPTFLVKSAVLRGGGLSPEQIEEAILRLNYERVFFVPKNHLILLSRSRMEEFFRQEFPQVRGITFYRRAFPDQIELEIEIRKPSFVWQSGQDFFLLDQEAVAFQKIAGYAPAAYSETLIIDSTVSPVRIGVGLDIPAVLTFTEEASKIWPRKIAQTSLAGYKLAGVKSLDIAAATAVGFEVYFDLNRRADIQLDNLALLLNREINPETLSGLAYIDLRLPDIAYYCYKDAPCAQKE